MTKYIVYSLCFVLICGHLSYLTTLEWSNCLRRSQSSVRLLGWESMLPGQSGHQSRSDYGVISPSLTVCEGPMYDLRYSHHSKT